jgi:hypothetical protein
MSQKYSQVPATGYLNTTRSTLIHTTPTRDVCVFFTFITRFKCVSNGLKTSQCARPVFVLLVEIELNFHIKPFKYLKYYPRKLIFGMCSFNS